MFDGSGNAAFSGTLADYISAKGPDLLARWDAHQDWFDARMGRGVDPYCKVSLTRTGTLAQSRLRCGRVVEGANFASQDYLNLSSHPAIAEAARGAISEFGVHSAGSSALMGCTALSEELERRLAAFLGYSDCTVFPTGWGAGYGIVKTLVRPEDHVVIDCLSHACLQEGARNATRNVHAFPHLSNDAVARRLTRIRDEHPEAGILVVTETVFSMDSDVPNLRELQALCRRHGATLLVDVAHDLGAIGPTGRGYLELMNLVGQVDIVMGSFSKTFATNGGFVASNHRAMKLMLRGHCGPLLFSNAISPIQAAIALAALDIVQGEEGAELRGQLLASSVALRAAFKDAGFKVGGQPTAIVPIYLGDARTSRLMTREMHEAGILVNLVEHPAVARNACRWRAQVMAKHDLEQVGRFVRAAVAARDRISKEIPCEG